MSRPATLSDLPKLYRLTLVEKKFATERLAQVLAMLPMPKCVVAESKQDSEPVGDVLPKTLLAQVGLLLQQFIACRNAGPFLKTAVTKEGEPTIVDSDLLAALSANVDDGLYFTLMPRDAASSAVLNAMLGAFLKDGRRFDYRDFLDKFCRSWLSDLEGTKPDSHKRGALIYLERAAGILDNSAMLTLKVRMGIKLGSFLGGISSTTFRQGLALSLAQHVTNLSYHDWVERRLLQKNALEQLSKLVDDRASLVQKAIACLAKPPSSEVALEKQAVQMVLERQGFLAAGQPLAASCLPDLIRQYNLRQAADMRELQQAAPSIIALNGHGDLMTRLRTRRFGEAHRLFQEWTHDERGHDRCVDVLMSIMQTERQCQQALQAMSIDAAPIAVRQSIVEAFDAAAATECLEANRAHVKQALMVLQRGFFDNPSVNDDRLNLEAAQALLACLEVLVKSGDNLVSRQHIEKFMIVFYQKRRDLMMRLAQVGAADDTLSVVMMALQPCVNALADSLSYRNHKQLEQAALDLLSLDSPAPSVPKA